MNVRMRASYSSMRMPRWEATLMDGLCLGLIAGTHANRQHRVLAESRIQFRKPAKIERRAFRRLHDRGVRTVGAQAYADVRTRFAAFSHGCRTRRGGSAEALA